MKSKTSDWSVLGLTLKQANKIHIGAGLQLKNLGITPIHAIRNRSRCVNYYKLCMKDTFGSTKTKAWLIYFRTEATYPIFLKSKESVPVHMHNLQSPVMFNSVRQTDPKLVNY